MTDHSGRNRRRWALLAALATAVAIPGAALAAGGGASPRTVVARAPDGPPSFDIREARAGRSLAAGRPASRRRAQRRMRRSLGTGAVVAIDRLTSTPRLVANASGSLTEHGRGRQGEIALGFVRRHAAAFGLDAADLNGLRVAQSYTTRGGLRIIRWQQTYRGIPAFDTGLRAALRGNRLVSIAGPPQPHLSVPSVRPRISKAAAMRVGVPHTARQRGYGGLTLFPEGSRARLAWKLVVFVDSTHVYLTVVDARNGTLLLRANQVESARGLVHSYFPGSNAAGGTDGLRTFPSTWLTDSSTLSGDNAHAYSDQDDNLGYDCTSTCFPLSDPSAGDEIQPSSGTDWSFTPVTGSFGGSGSEAGRSCPAAGCTWNGFSSDADPSNWTGNREQAGTQLYWFVNNFHDYLKADGGIQFDEASGNFEVSSPGADPVAAQVDDGAETASGGGFPDEDHVNNANMLTLPQSAPSGLSEPKMQMYLWSADSPHSAGIHDVNGADDASVVYHEYTHGLSNRLVDPNDTGGLFTDQGGAMGEAWSDWYAMDYLVGQGLDVDTAVPGDVQLAKYEIPGGLRSEGMDCPPGGGGALCPGSPFGAGGGGYTLGDFGKVDGGPEVHADGEIWGQTLWDLRRSLISHYGATTGERHVRELVTDAMRLGPAAPTFIDMRNAILSANNADRLGDCDRIWAVFAARGMGEHAETTGPNDDVPFEEFTNPSATACPHTKVTPPAPKPPAKASFKKSKKTIRVSRSGRFSFSFTAAPGLGGRITLKTVRKVSLRKHGHKRRTTFANKTFTVPGSGKVKVKFKLSSRNRKILKRYKKLRLTVTVKLRSSAGLTSRATVRITLKAPRRAHH